MVREGLKEKLRDVQKGNIEKSLELTLSYLLTLLLGYLLTCLHGRQNWPVMGSWSTIQASVGLKSLSEVN